MERKIRNLEQHVEFLYEELENKEQEIDELKKTLVSKSRKHVLLKRREFGRVC